MLIKGLVAIAKPGVVLFAILECLAITMFVMLMVPFGIEFLTRNGNWPWGLEHPMNGVLFAFSIVLSCALLIPRNIGKAADIFFDLDGWAYEIALRRLPQLIICHNNGVIAVATKAEYQDSPDWFVPNVMTFSDSESPRLRELVTGTMADFDRLTHDARVTDVFVPGQLYVPYTSGILKPEAEARLFPHVSLEEAERRIWQGYKRPKQKSA